MSIIPLNLLVWVLKLSKVEGAQTLFFLSAKGLFGIRQKRVLRHLEIVTLTSAERASELVEMFENIVKVPTRKVLGDGSPSSEDLLQDFKGLPQVEETLDGHLDEEVRVLLHAIELLVSRSLNHNLWELLIYFL